MEPGSVREKRDPQSVPVGAQRRADVRPMYTDGSVDAMAERLAELADSLQKKKEVFAQLQQRREELNKKKKEQDELHSNYYVFFETKRPKVCLQAVERKRKHMEALQREVEQLKEECAELMEKKQQQQHRVKSHKKYRDYMERAVNMTEFEDTEKLALQLENQLHFKDQLTQRYIDAQEQTDQCRKTLRMLEDQSNLLKLQKTTQLTQLQNELQTTHSETLTWEKQCDQIDGMAAKKTLLLAKIKMGTLNLYEQTQGTVEGVEVVDMNDTEKQLDEIKIWIQDHNSVRPYKDPNHKDGAGQKRKEEKGDKAKGSQ